MSTKEQKAVVHILKKKYNISNEEYYNALYDTFKVESSKYLSEEECTQFIHFLNYTYNKDYSLGFDNGLKMFYNFFGNDIEANFERAVNMTQKRDITNLEKIMFDSLSDDDKQKLVKSMLTNWTIKEV